MGKLEALSAVTEELAEELNRLDEPGLDRDKLIEQVNSLIEQRDQILQQLHKPYTEEEMITGRKIINLNNHISKQLDRLYEAIKKDMKQVQKKKSQNYSYLKPYGDLKTSDGMYMDNKL